MPHLNRTKVAPGDSSMSSQLSKRKGTDYRQDNCSKGTEGDNSDRIPDALCTSRPTPEPSREDQPAEATHQWKYPEE